MSHGMVNPQTEGLVFHVCATSRAAATDLAAHANLPQLRELITLHPRIDHAPLLPLLDTYPDGAGQWGSCANLHLSGPAGGDAPTSLPQHGVALRIRIPYARAELCEPRLNGAPMAQSETDGYASYRDRGYTYLQVNIPPSRAAREDLFVVTCGYDPKEKRRQGWEPRG